jgi:hypothetical protein
LSYYQNVRELISDEKIQEVTIRLARVHPKNTTTVSAVYTSIINDVSLNQAQKSSLRERVRVVLRKLKEEKILSLKSKHREHTYELLQR